MRATVYCVLLALFVIACRSTPKPEPAIANRTPPPVTVKITLDDELRDRLAIGLAMDLELRADKVPVGNCTLAFDLWDETYRVWLSKSDVHADPDPIRALRTCVDPTRLRGDGNVVVYELEPKKPLYVPMKYDTF